MEYDSAVDIPAEDLRTMTMLDGLKTQGYACYNDGIQDATDIVTIRDTRDNALCAIGDGRSMPDSVYAELSGLCTNPQYVQRGMAMLVASVLVCRFLLAGRYHVICAAAHDATAVICKRLGMSDESNSMRIHSAQYNTAELKYQLAASIAANTSACKLNNDVQPSETLQQAINEVRGSQRAGRRRRLRPRRRTSHRRRTTHRRRTSHHRFRRRATRRR